MKILRYITIATVLLTLGSCEKFLDKNPDSRVELDSPDKVAKLLVNAYPSTTPAVIAELSSDNVDDMINHRRGNLFTEELVYWKKELHEYGTKDGLRELWNDHYSVIYTCNVAINAIKELQKTAKDKATQDQLKASLGEALVSRAYAHFVLVNLFGKPYNPQTSSTDLGVPYVEIPLEEFKAELPRNTVAEVYKKIAEDLQQGLPLIDDNSYKVPKFHFNKRAANAFAARFYLYHQDFAKAEEHATNALGDNPTLRNYKAFSAISADDPHAKEYTRDDVEANLMLIAVETNGYAVLEQNSPFRFTHGRPLAQRETFLSEGNPWVNEYKDKVFYKADAEKDRYVYTKYPVYPNKTQLVLFNTEETLLVRAEAKILQGKNTEGLKDMNLFLGNYLEQGDQLDEARVVNTYKRLPYSSYDTNTLVSRANQKKRLSPSFTIADETQECLLHCLLQCRRLLTLNEGLRWYDIRRYGIEIYRHELHLDGSSKIVAVLTKDDNRRTFPIPADVVAAGMKDNPR